MNRENRQDPISVSSGPADEGQPGQVIQVDQRTNMIIQQDGSALFVPIMHQVDPHSFDANLALVLNEDILSRLGFKLHEAIEEDIQSRAEWEQALTKTLDSLKLTPKDMAWPFENASGYTSDVLMFVLLKTVTSVMAELFPPEGPAKEYLIGEETQELAERAERIVEFINIYLTRLNKDYYPDKEQMITWGVLNGSVFSKTYFDPVYQKVQTSLIKPMDLIVNYGTKDLESAARITHSLIMSTKDFKRRMMAGFYRDIDIHPYDDETENNDVNEKYDSIMGQQLNYDSYNKTYRLYECHVDLDLDGMRHQDENGEETGIPLPYVVTLDLESQKILSIYRNWKEGDELFTKKKCFTHYGYLPSLGFYKWGLLHVCSGNAAAATQLGRMIHDAAMLANFPGGLRIEGMRMEDNNIKIGPTEFVAVNTMGQKIQDAIMLLPFKEAGPGLVSFKSELEESIRNMAGMADLPFTDFNPNAPVGTTLAMMEQSNKLQSGVVRRYHRALGEELEIIYALFGEHLQEEPYPYLVGNDNKFIMKSDFSPSLSIVPVSNPNLMTSSHRLIQNESILKIATSSPDIQQMFDMREVIRPMLIEMKVPNIDKVLPPPPSPPPPVTADPLSENIAVSQGQQILAVNGQDHRSHMPVHKYEIDRLKECMQNNPQDPKYSSMIDQLRVHNMLHQALMNTEEVVAQAGMPLQQGQQIDPKQLDINMQNQIAFIEAQQIEFLNQQEYAGSADGLSGPPLDPGRVLLQEVRVKEKGLEIKEALDTGRLDLDRQKLDLERIKLKEKLNFDVQKLELDIEDVKNKNKNSELKNKFQAAKDMKDLELKEIMTRSKLRLD